MRPPLLDRKQIHVWTISLTVDGDAERIPHPILSDGEQRRADRFLTAQGRSRYIVARAFLRRLLSTYLGRDPASLTINHGTHGKPCLEDARGIRFNLSHAGDTAMVAVALQREVGVDIEAVTRDVEIDGVARQSFSVAERGVLASLTPGTRRDAFFRIWVRKEAYVKARGDGLSYPTRSFSVSHFPADADALLADDQEPEAPVDWRVAEIEVRDGYRAALAAPGRDWSILQMNAAAIAEDHVGGFHRTGPE